VLVSLAKQILDNLAEGVDAGIFTEDFQYSTPTSGPMNKDAMLEQFSVNLKKLFSDFDWNPQNFEVDR
jgi:hypothetical protein